MVQGVIELDLELSTLRKEKDEYCDMMQFAVMVVRKSGKTVPSEMNEWLQKKSRKFMLGIVWPKEKLLSSSKKLLVESCVREVYTAVKEDHGIAAHNVWKEAPEREFL